MTPDLLLLGDKLFIKSLANHFSDLRLSFVFCLINCSRNRSSIDKQSLESNQQLSDGKDLAINHKLRQSSFVEANSISNFFDNGHNVSTRIIRPDGGIDVVKSSLVICTSPQFKIEKLLQTDTLNVINNYQKNSEPIRVGRVHMMGPNPRAIRSHITQHLLSDLPSRYKPIRSNSLRDNDFRPSVITSKP